MKNKSQQGSGSAENTGKPRSEQVNKNMDISNQDKQDIAHELNDTANHIAGLKDMGSLSGRDDASGGSGDRMEEENTSEGTR